MTVYIRIPYQSSHHCKLVLNDLVLVKRDPEIACKVADNRAATVVCGAAEVSAKCDDLAAVARFQEACYVLASCRRASGYQYRVFWRTYHLQLLHR